LSNNIDCVVKVTQNWGLNW